jgi:hypothetical protein
MCDINHYIHDLNTILHGQHKLISDMVGAVRTFEMKLKLFWKQLENVNLMRESIGYSASCVRTGARRNMWDRS